MWVVYTVLSKGVGESRRLPISSDATLHARYEGTLSHVDAENSCVTLDNVKSWGTEGRTSKDAEVSLMGWNEFGVWKLGGGGGRLFHFNSELIRNVTMWLMGGVRDPDTKNSVY